MPSREADAADAADVGDAEPVVTRPALAERVRIECGFKVPQLVQNMW